MNTPGHWQRDSRYPDRDRRVRKARREMALVALERTPRSRLMRCLWLRWVIFRSRTGRPSHTG